MKTELESANFQHEIDYWDKELSLNGAYPDAIRFRSIPELMHHEFPFYLMPYFIELTIRGTYKPKVIDVGSGPLSMLNYGHYNGLFDLVCADPLANVYNQLLEKYNIPQYAELVPCFGEHLSARFGPNSFDMVWMHNAIDHAQSPPNVFKELTAILRPGGYLVLQGWTREGTAEGWHGLHQHDVYLAPNGKLMCDSKIKNSDETWVTCMNQGLPLEIVYSTEPSFEPRTWIRLIFRKIQD